jgi:histidine triad (HIT) family protein
MSKTIFDDIVSGALPSWKIWEDETYLAFLTPFPSTPGLTVVIPKHNIGDDVFALNDETFTGLMLATKKVAALLSDRLHVKRVAMVFEGTGVAHVHAKLYPLHGALASKTAVWSSHQEFYPEYIGYLSTVEGPRMTDDALTVLQQKIVGAGT